MTLKTENQGESHSIDVKNEKDSPLVPSQQAPAPMIETTGVVLIDSPESDTIEDSQLPIGENELEQQKSTERNNDGISKNFVNTGGNNNIYQYRVEIEEVVENNKHFVIFSLNDLLRNETTFKNKYPAMKFVGNDNDIHKELGNALHKLLKPTYRKTVTECKQLATEGIDFLVSTYGVTVKTNHDLFRTTLKGIGRVYTENGELIKLEAANYVSNQYNVTSIMEANGEFAYYANGVYKMDYKGQHIRHLVQNLQTNVDLHEKIEIVEHIRDINKSFKDEFNPDFIYLNVKNGLYNINTKKLESHTAKIKRFIQFEVEYDPEATCPKFEKFLQEILPDEKDRTRLMEALAVNLLPTSGGGKIVYLVGKGANGKSVIIHIFQSIIGKDAYAGISIQKLEKDKFAISGLRGKLVNIFSDLPTEMIWDTSNTKLLSGKDTFDSERKFESAQTFKPFCGQIYSMNQIPAVKEVDLQNDGFMRRLYLVLFKVQFFGDKQNEGLREELLAEKSGIFNLFLKHMHNVIDRGMKLDADVDFDELRELYKEKSSDVAAFCDNMLEEYHSDIDKEFVYTVYQLWASSKELRPTEYQMFCKKLVKLGYRTERQSVMDEKGRRPHIWAGVRITRKAVLFMLEQEGLDLLTIEKLQAMKAKFGEESKDVFVANHNLKQSHVLSDAIGSLN